MNEKSHKSQNIISVLSVAIFILLCTFKTAFALDIKATIDKDEAVLSEHLILTVIVSGESKNASEPSFNNMRDFVISRSGSSTRMSIVNGQMSVSKEYTYILIPQKIGNLVIPSIVVRENGKVYKSSAIKVKITKQPSSNSSSGAVHKREIFLEASTSDKKAYVNQQIIYTIKIFRKVDISNATLEGLDIKGAWVEDLGKDKTYSRVINGRSYYVHEINKALFPQAPGELIIPMVKLRCDVPVKTKKRRKKRGSFFDDSFFGFTQMQTRIIAANEVVVNILPLPEQEKPKDFSGMVGNLNLNVQLSKQNAKVGDSITITAVVQGKGNFNSMGDIEFNIPKEFKLYVDKPVVEVSNNGKYVYGKKVFKRMIVPQKEGIFDLKDIGMSYFDPVLKKYKSLNSGYMAVKVLPADEAEKLNVVAPIIIENSHKKEVEILGKDILSVHTSVDHFYSFLRLNTVVALIGFLFPICIFGFCLIHNQRKLKISSDKGYARKLKAHDFAKTEFKEIKKQFVTNLIDKSGYLTAINRTVRDFIGNRLNIQGSALTPDEAWPLLIKYGASKESAEEVKQLLQKLHDQQFMPGSMINENDLDEIAERAEKLIKILLKELK